MAKLPNDDYDGAWKSALSVYLQDFLALCFPAIHAAMIGHGPIAFSKLSSSVPPATINKDAARPTSWLRFGGVIVSLPGC
jgi:hypothetical protein